MTTSYEAKLEAEIETLRSRIKVLERGVDYRTMSAVRKALIARLESELADAGAEMYDYYMSTGKRLKRYFED